MFQYFTGGVMNFVNGGEVRVARPQFLISAADFTLILGCSLFPVVSIITWRSQSDQIDEIKPGRTESQIFCPPALKLYAEQREEEDKP